MRKGRFDRLLAGTVLSLIVAAPTLSNAAPDRIESVGPLPPSLNGQLPRHRDAAPVPPPPATYVPAPPSRNADTDAPRNADVSPPRNTDTAAPANSDSGGFGIKSAIDKLFAAS